MVKSFVPVRAACAAAVLVLASATLSCGGDERRTFIDPYGSSQAPTFDWPAEGDDLTRGGLRLSPVPAIAYVDDTSHTAEPLTFAVVDESGADVTAQARFAVRDLRLGSFVGPVFTPKLGSSELHALTMVGAKVGERTGFAYVAIVRQRRTGDRPDVPVVAPEGAEPAPAAVTLKVGGGVQRVDAAIVMDTTGSMSGSIKDLTESLRTKLVPELAKQIPELGLALVEHKDYPLKPYGDSGDFPVKVHQPITDDIASIHAALGTLKASGGADLPESQMPAMMHILTGQALSWTGGGVAARPASPGTVGIGFRAGALPVVVLVTDIDWHEASHDPYDPTDVPSTPSMAELAAAFEKVHARFVNVTEDGREAQADDLSDRTGSSVAPDAFGGACGVGACCTGVGGKARPPSGPGGRCRLNFLHDDGAGVSTSIVSAIGGLTIGSSFDVSLILSNDPDNPEGVDATKLVQSTRALTDGDAASGCAAHATKDADGDGVADTFVDAPVSKPVCFGLTLAKNVIVPASTKPQVVNAYLDVRGQPGDVLLERRRIVFLIPAR